MSWTNAQKKYSNSAKGRASRQKYQSSAKGKASRAAYMARRKAKHLELKQSDATANEPQVEEKVVESAIDLVEKKAEVVKIKKAP